MTSKITDFIRNTGPETPCLVLDVDAVSARYRDLTEALPEARIYYAVKANPARPVLERLAAAGSCFDAASWEEIRMCLETGVTPDRISFGNTVKKASAIRRAWEAGIRLFASDSAEEMEKLAEYAPGSRVYCRLLVDNDGAEWPLSRKFGATADQAVAFMQEAAELGLEPYGLSFHVGSQQVCPAAWEEAIRKAGSVARRLSENGITVKMLNIGGGFPVSYRETVPDIGVFAQRIRDALTAEFGPDQPEVLAEPGRYIVGDAGVIASEVVLVSRRGPTEDHRWVYLDAGRFGGLAETEGEAIRYRILTDRDGDPAGPVSLAGPTCDGADILYEKTPYALPLSLTSGDRVTILSAGAYVSTYCSTGFNGFAPLAEYYI